MSHGDLPVSLCISASGGGYSCALRLSDGTLLTDPGEPRQLASLVARLFDRANLPPTALRELRLDLGPGSYTGLRVAVTFARTVQAFGDVTVLTATSLELLALRAWNVGQVDRSATVRPVLDARRERFHHAAVRLEEKVVLAEPLAAVGFEELVDSIGDDDVLLVEESILPQLETIGAQRPCTIATLDADRALAELLLDPRLAPRVTAAEELEPLYLMGSYAD